MFDFNFYNGKKVLVTGHTGFKGTWLSMMLLKAGADVTGYALEAPTKPSLYDITGIEKNIRSETGDIRDYDHLKRLFDEIKPDIVFHLAAQPIVRESYKKPVETYEINVMGTVNILECIRTGSSVRSFLNVTTDKVYKNKEWEWGYRECDELDGFDPYSNSKSCSELVTHSYRSSFFSGDSSTGDLSDKSIAISTARAGNVIGGGDFAKDRIIPDCVRAAIDGQDIIVRNPHSIRPYQHVLDPLYAYMMIAASQYDKPSLSGEYNVGPDSSGCVSTGQLVDKFISLWGDGIGWIDRSDGGPHEANFLKLDCSKLKNKFGWSPVWNIEQALEATVGWTKCWLNKEQDISLYMNEQIESFMELATHTTEIKKI